MNYYLYKLSFDSAVHFGSSDSALSLYTSEDHFLADTLFSALCHTALTLKGPECLAALCETARSGELILSDSMPWQGERLYLPKPCANNESSQELPPELRKAVKKLMWIPLDAMEAFSDSLHDGELFDVADAAAEFGKTSERTKASIHPGADTVPYPVGQFSFRSECGLWLIAGCKTEEQGELLELLMEGLGLSGIGGKVSSGYGKFHLEDVIYLNDDNTTWLYQALTDEAAEKQLLLTSSLPSDEELEELIPESTYRLIRRGGFVQSPSYDETARKKRSQFFLAAGSVLPARFRPVLYSVGEENHHPVYRFSAPVMLGVEL